MFRSIRIKLYLLLEWAEKSSLTIWKAYSPEKAVSQNVCESNPRVYLRMILSASILKL